jgi:hypothetical protein
MSVFQEYFCTSRTELQGFIKGVMVSVVGLGAIEFIIMPVLLIIFCNRHFRWVSWLAFLVYYMALFATLEKWLESTTGCSASFRIPTSAFEAHPKRW